MVDQDKQQEVIIVRNVLKRLQKMEMEKGIKYALIFYLILVLADLVSTLMSWELVEYLEANPLFNYGGLPLIIFLNILIVYIFYKIYTKTENTNLRFYILFILVSVMTTRCIVIWSNIQIALNPPTIEQIMSIPAESLKQMKVTQTVEMIALNMLPLLNGAVTWILFNKDHEVRKWKKKKDSLEKSLKKTLNLTLKELKKELKILLTR